MASLYTRRNRIWIGFRDSEGKRRNRSTGYRANNIGERKKAERLCKLMTADEREYGLHPPDTLTWNWVPEYIEARYGHLQATTPSRYRARWQTLQKWLAERAITGPRNLRREDCLGYLVWRKAGRNTSLSELKLLGLIMAEAVRREYVTTNVAAKLGLKHATPKAKRPFTDAELDAVDKHLVETDRYGWMRVAYLLGRYQAARLSSCALPLGDIDLHSETLTYRNPKGGPAKAYSQPISEKLLPALKDLVEHRRAEGHATLADIPTLASLEFRKLLDGLNVKGVSHHSLRVTWITKAALAGIPEVIAQKYAGHATSSTEVHRLYVRLSTGDIREALKRLS
jgi:hypothetical protein